MRTTLTLAASLVINLVALAAMSWSVHEAQLAPNGVVTITQLAE